MYFFFRRIFMFCCSFFKANDILGLAEQKHRNWQLCWQFLTAQTIYFWGILYWPLSWPIWFSKDYLNGCLSKNHTYSIGHKDGCFPIINSFEGGTFGKKITLYIDSEEMLKMLRSRLRYLVLKDHWSYFLIHCPSFYKELSVSP